MNLADNLNGDQIIILDIALLESRSAIRRRVREGHVSSSDAHIILDQIEEDARALYLVQPSSMAIGETARLLDLHPLRTLDALHLAGCLTLRYSIPAPLTFVCADRRLCDAAAREGLATLNPLDAGGSKD
jgi:hypothetical protein